MYNLRKWGFYYCILWPWHFEPAGQLQTFMIKSTEMSNTFRTLKFVENGQQTAGLLLATQSERLINLLLDAKESVCTTCEEKQIWLVSLTELSFEVNFPDIEDLQLRMLKRKLCSQDDLWKEAEGSVSGIKIQKLLKMRKKMVGVESEKKKKHSQVLKDWSLRILRTLSFKLTLSLTTWENFKADKASQVVWKPREVNKRWLFICNGVWENVWIFF